LHNLSFKPIIKLLTISVVVLASYSTWKAVLNDQMICIWSSWCYCHRPIISCFIKIQNGLPFWCWLTKVDVVLEKAVKRVSVGAYFDVSVCGKHHLHFTGLEKGKTMRLLCPLTEQLW